MASDKQIRKMIAETEELKRLATNLREHVDSKNWRLHLPIRSRII